MDRPFCRAVAARAASASPSKARARGAVVDRPGAESFPKAKRLAKRREFLRIYETGRKQFSRFAAVFFAENGLGHSRLGITVTKKVGKAATRNRLKRWTREIYRRQREPLGIDAPALDIVINVKGNAADTSFEDFHRDLTRAFERVVAEASRRRPN